MTRKSGRPFGEVDNKISRLIGLSEHELTKPARSAEYRRWRYDKKLPNLDLLYFLPSRLLIFVSGIILIICENAVLDLRRLPHLVTWLNSRPLPRCATPMHPVLQVLFPTASSPNISIFQYFPEKKLSTFHTSNKPSRLSVH